LARGESEDERRLFPVPVGRLMSREHGWIMTSLLNLFSLAIARRRVAASKNPEWKRLHMIDLSQCVRMPLGKDALFYRCL
jgi:hypothetical protein